MLNSSFNNIAAFFRIIKCKTYDIYNNYNKNNSAIRQKEPPYLYDKISYFFTTPSLIITHNNNNIYLGSGYSSANYSTLSELNITKIINVTAEIPNYFEDDFSYLQVPIFDNSHATLYEHFDNIIEFLDSDTPNQNIFIHCYQGASRSASVVLLFLVFICKYTLSDAISYLDKTHPINNINVNFMNDLEKYITKHELFHSENTIT